VSNVAVHSAGTLRGLETLDAGVHQAIELTIRAAVEAAKASAKGTDKFKDRTGETRGSIHGEALGLNGFVQAGGAARFLEFGTPPHIIRARNASALRFVQNGRVVFRKWVRHPGTRERPFMREAQAHGEIAAEYRAEEYINYAIARAR